MCVCVCVCVCVEVIVAYYCVWTCNLFLVYVCVKIHTQRDKFEVVFRIGITKCINAKGNAESLVIDFYFGPHS